MKPPKKAQEGFSLLELVFVLIILSLIGGMTMTYLRNGDDAERFEATRAKLEAIRLAVLGDPQGREGSGAQARFGYHGDLGTLPPSLAAITAPQAPAWTLVGTLGIGAGWRGPYARPEFPDPYSLQTDAWGTAFVYSTTSVTSFGANKVAGGSGFDSDLVVSLSTASRRARVWGIVSDGATRLSNRVVRLHFPAAGVIANSAVVTDTGGVFSFTNVPFGPCALQVTNSPGIGPKLIVVDAPEYMVPDSTLNYFGALQNITANTSTASCVSSLRHRVNITNSYAALGTLTAFTAWWSNTTRLLNTVVLNSVSNGVGSTASGTRVVLGTALTIGAGATAPLDLRFTTKMDTAPITARLEWSHTQDTETISWVTSTCANPSIAVLNTQSSSSNSNASTLSFGYTIPSGAISPTLVVSVAGEDNSDDAIVRSVHFGTGPMTLVTKLRSDGSGSRTGLGMYWMAVTGNQKGTVMASFPGNLQSRHLSVYTLTSTDQSGPEAVKAVVDASGDISTSITSLTEDAMAATAGTNINKASMIATGTNHVLDMYEDTSNSSSAMGHIEMPVPLTLNSIGFASSNTDESIEIISVFTYQP